MEFMINKQKFLKNIFVSVEPTDQRGELRCVDSSDKKEIGKSHEIPVYYKADSTPKCN